MTDPAEQVHVVLGMSEAAYELAMIIGRNTIGWEGMPVTNEPRWHSHPALEITGHAHGPTVEAARTPHTHRQVLQWDFTPLPVNKKEVSGD